MPTIYGEGRDNAFKRLREEIDKPLKLCSNLLADFGFRILTLEPRAIGSNITGHIQVYSLLDPPPYYALSYVWGPEPEIHQVVINSKAKFIRPNLFHALQRIRLRRGHIHIWVDSICIN